MEFKTVKYPNNRRGIKKKNAESVRLINEGWKIQSESIEQGKFRGGDACCFGVVCLPCAFLAGSSDGYIVVTYAK